MVQDMYDAGRLAEINDYCRCDVLDTYFVFLRTGRAAGPPDAGAGAGTDRPDQSSGWGAGPQTPAYQHYLQNWGDWPNPWQPVAAGPVSSQPG